MTVISDRLNNSHSIATKTISKLKELNIKPLPENYVVWFSYFADTNPDLTKTIDILFTNNKPIDEEITRQLYKKFYTFEIEGEQYLKTAQKTDSALHEIKNYLIDYSQQTNEYDSQLKGVSEKINADSSQENIQELLEIMIKSTKIIQLQNTTLQNKLDTSQQEIDSLKHNLDNLKVEATTDNLTGIANRKLFEATLLKDMTASVEDGKPLSLLMIDIDHFKNFNDAHGHLVGDQVIRLVAQTISKHTPPNGLPSRYGGEEFTIVLPNLTSLEAQKLANDIRLSMASKLLQNKKTGDSLGKITVSIGTTAFRFGESMVDFIDRADEALYAAKNAGRNRVVLM
ncbi:MAG: GGDEF domain-containing protein [Alphaproteobacteria bacterium]|nr:GGDEF domain-containing protein [Alphaproteobacteria bacterium]